MVVAGRNSVVEGRRREFAGVVVAEAACLLGVRKIGEGRGQRLARRNLSVDRGACCGVGVIGCCSGGRETAAATAAATSAAAVAATAAIAVAGSIYAGGWIALGTATLEDLG